MKGCKPVEMMQMVGGSAVISHCTSYYPSPCCASYNPSRGTSSFVSPFTSFYVANPNNAANPSNAADGNSLIPWLKNLSPGPSASTSKFPHLFMQNGPFSAPVTPALNSHSEPRPQFKSDCPSGLGQQQQQYSFQPFSTLPTPVGQVLDPKWINVGVPQGGQAPPPAISIVAPNPIGFKEEVFVGSGGSGMSLPGKSVTCSSAVAATSSDHTADIPMADAVSSEFAFKSSISPALVKAWKGEKVHEATVADDLELTLGNSKTRLLRK
ncbi:hypothetical protein RIF29_38967 [Crotalaria pallida]|uniref:Protein BZR1 homolog n=1 Tax=Crotalaria pallida TaxID=3830 RepID=A0AAN9E0T5_CROPI